LSSAELVKDDWCGLCTETMDQWKSILVQNSTEQDFKELLLDLCTEIGFLVDQVSGETMHLVLDYGYEAGQFPSSAHLVTIVNAIPCFSRAFHFRMELKTCKSRLEITAS
jgi:hypothetical protein